VRRSRKSASLHAADESEYEKSLSQLQHSASALSTNSHTPLAASPLRAGSKPPPPASAPDKPPPPPSPAPIDDRRSSQRAHDQVATHHAHVVAESRGQQRQQHRQQWQ
jgi:hypothetical protein